MNKEVEEKDENEAEVTSETETVLEADAAPEAELESETEATPDESESEQPKEKKQGRGRGGVFLVALLALGALGASGFLYQQQEMQKKDLQVLQQGASKLLNQVEQRQQALLERLNTVTAQQKAETDSRLQLLEQLIDDTRSRLGMDRSAWSLAEAEHLVRIAEHGLTLQHDTASAIAALRTAKSRLEADNPKRFATVIARLTNDIDTLASIQLPDRAAMATTLSAVATMVEQLPLARRAKPAAALEAAKAEEIAAESAKRTGWDKIWFDLSNLITIRHEDEVFVQPMLPPERRYFLQQNLRLKLEEARLALLLDDTPAWHANLGETTSWLRRYFDTEDPAVTDALAKLDKLAATKLVPALPDLATTRKLIERLAKLAEQKLPATAKTNSKATTKTATPAAKPAAKAPAKQATPPTETPSTVPQPSQGDAQ